MMGRWPIAVGVAVVVFAYAGAGDSQPVLAVGSEAEVTGDGLHRVDPRIMPGAFVKPDLDLWHYTKILVMPSLVSFRDVDRTYDPRGGVGGSVEHPVSEREKDRFRIGFGERFKDYPIRLKPYEIYEGAGRDVLMVRGYLIDVVSGVPPMRAGHHTTFIRKPWEVTAMIELRDSMSDEVLARSMDRLRIEGFYDATEIPRVTSIAMTQWSELLLERLRELIDAGGGRWSRCQLEGLDCAL